GRLLARARDLRALDRSPAGVALRQATARDQARAREVQAKARRLAAPRDPGASRGSFPQRRGDVSRVQASAQRRREEETSRTQTRRSGDVAASAVSTVSTQVPPRARYALRVSTVHGSRRRADAELPFVRDRV